MSAFDVGRPVYLTFERSNCSDPAIKPAMRSSIMLTGSVFQTDRAVEGAQGEAVTMAGIKVGRVFGSLAALVASVLVVSLASPAEARITRIAITSVQSPSFEGTSFGA